MKNKAPASLQITAEQLLREAKERQLEIVPAPPKQKIQDAAELADYQVRFDTKFYVFEHIFYYNVYKSLYFSLYYLL